MSDRNSDDGRNESEVSQLLPPQMSTPPGKQPSLLLLLYAITICLYLAEYIALAPRTEIYESVICRNRHPDITINGAFTGSATWYENKCKGREVQQELALLQGTERLLGALPTILAIPYGILADKYGRKLALSLAILGIFLEEAWTFSVSWFSDVLPIRLVWLGPMFEVVGGGVGVFSTMIHVIIADVATAEARTIIFFRLHAAGVVAAMLAQSMASALMSKLQNPWIPWITGLVFMLAGLFFSAILPTTIVPQTLKLSSARTTVEYENSGNGAFKNAPSTTREKLTSALNSLRKTGSLMTTSAQVSLLLVLVFTCLLGTNSISMVLLLYMSKKFTWSFAEANMLWFLGEGIELCTLVILLPFLSSVFLSRLQLSNHAKDRYITQGCTFMLMLGALCLGSAPNIALAIFGLVMMSIGTGIADILRSLITYIIEPEDITVVYSTVTILMVLGSSLAGPLYSGTFAAGLALGPQWTGLPFMISSGLFGLAFLILLFVG